MSIGKRIVEERKKLKLTQEDLAEKIYVSRQSISKWESDLVTPDLDNIKALSSLFNCSIEYLVNGKENNNKFILTMDLIVLILGSIILIFSIIMYTINPSIIDDTGSVIYLNFFILLIIIAFILVLIGLYLAYKKKRK